MTGKVMPSQYAGKCKLCKIAYNVGDQIIYQKIDNTAIVCTSEVCFNRQVADAANRATSQQTPTQPTSGGAPHPDDALKRTEIWNDKIVPMIKEKAGQDNDKLFFWGRLYLQVYLGEVAKTG